MIEFDWDKAKAASNRAKHRVTFDEGITVFNDAPEIFDDNPHSESEFRYSVIGWSDRARMLVVTATDRGAIVRIISARLASPREVRQWQNTK